MDDGARWRQGSGLKKPHWDSEIRMLGMGPDRLAWGHAFGMVGVSDRDPRSFSLTVYAGPSRLWTHTRHENPAAAGALGGGPTFELVGQNVITMITQDVGS